MKVALLRNLFFFNPVVAHPAEYTLGFSNCVAAILFNRGIFSIDVIIVSLLLRNWPFCFSRKVNCANAEFNVEPCSKCEAY